MSYANVSAGAPILAQTINDLILAAINRPMCRLALPANQSINNTTVTSIAFGSGSETRDDRNWHSTSSNTSRVTPDLLGRYLCIANIGWAGNATGDRRTYIAKSGTTNGNFGRAVNLNTSGPQVQAMGVWEIDTLGQYFECQGYQSSGGALAASGAGDATFSTTFEVIYMGGVI